MSLLPQPKWLAAVKPLLVALYAAGISHDVVIEALKTMLVIARKKTDADLARRRRGE